MILARRIASVFGIMLLVYVSLQTTFGGVDRKATEIELQQFVAAGGSFADFCGERGHVHDHCPLCTLLDHSDQRRDVGARPASHMLGQAALEQGQRVADGARFLRPHLRAPPVA